MCVTNGGVEIPVALNPCRNCHAKNQVLMIPAGMAKNKTFIIECLCCQSSTPVLPDAAAREFWNKENPL